MSVSRPRRLPPYPELDAFRPRYNSLKPKEREELAHLAEMLQPYHQGKFHPDPGWYGIMSRLAQFGARLRPPVALRDEGDALARIQSRKQEAETNDKAGAKAVEELQAALRRQREECVAAAELVRNAAEELARAEMDESDRAEADELAPATNNATGPLAQKLANALLTWMSLLPDLGKQETAWNLAEWWPQQGKNGDEWEIVKEWLYAGADYAVCTASWFPRRFRRAAGRPRSGRAERANGAPSGSYGRPCYETISLKRRHTGCSWRATKRRSGPRTSGYSDPSWTCCLKRRAGFRKSESRKPRRPP